MTGWYRWVVRAVAVAGLAVVAWALATGWGAVVHGHPAYLLLLAATAAGCAAALLRTRRDRPARSAWRQALQIVGLVAAACWIALMAWLRPFTAVEPALTAMETDSTVTVSEYPTQIVLAPSGAGTGTGVFFQPGAKVDARAYAAVLRPLAEAGHTVVIVKQPLGIGFLALPAFDPVADAHQEVSRWVVGGHSLGGTVAAIQAETGQDRTPSPVTGLLLYASYPASDLSDSLTTRVLSISASNDTLASPDKITSSKADLPNTATFTFIDGAVHAFFGDYGSQPGDGTPTISHDEARIAISQDTRQFVDALTP